MGSKFIPIPGENPELSHLKWMEQLRHGDGADLQYVLALASIFTPLVHEVTQGISQYLETGVNRTNLLKLQYPGEVVKTNYANRPEAFFNKWHVDGVPIIQSRERLKFKTQNEPNRFWNPALYIAVGEYGIEPAEQLLAAGRIALTLCEDIMTQTETTDQMDSRYGWFLEQETALNYTLFSMMEAVRISAGQLSLMSLEYYQLYPHYVDLMRALISSNAINHAGRRTSFGLTDFTMVNLGTYFADILDKDRPYHMTRQYKSALTISKREVNLNVMAGSRGEGCPASYKNIFGPDGTRYLESGINMMTDLIVNIYEAIA